MSNQILPEVYFDSLSISHKLYKFLDGFERSEIHLFSYFSAILFHYKGNSINDWKYKFIVSADGFPHSKDLDESITKHLLNGYFDENNGFMVVTRRGIDEFNTFSKHFPRFKKREKYIDAACLTSILIPYQDTKRALLNDPNLKTGLDKPNPDKIAFSNAKLSQQPTGRAGGLS